MTYININQTHFWDTNHNILWDRTIFEMILKEKGENSSSVVYNSLFTWQEAIQHCENQNTAVLKWRLPKVDELNSLSNYIKETNSTHEDYFYSNSDDFSNSFWSSSEVEGSEDEVYAVNFGIGRGIERRKIFNHCNTVFVSDSDPISISNINLSIEGNFKKVNVAKIKRIVSGKVLQNHDSVRDTINILN